MDSKHYWEKEHSSPREAAAATLVNAAAKPSPYIRAEHRALRQFLATPAAGFVGRSALLDRLEQFCLTPGEKQAICLTGREGSGKSALLAALARRLLPRASSSPSRARTAVDNEAVAVAASGAGVVHWLRSVVGGQTAKPACQEWSAGMSRVAAPSAAPADATGLLLLMCTHRDGNPGRQPAVTVHRWIAELRHLLDLQQRGDEHVSPGDLRADFHALLYQAAEQHRVVVLIDSLDRFAAGNGATNHSLLGWLPPRLPSNLRLLACCAPGPLSEALAARDGFLTEPLAPLTEGEATSLIQGFCSRSRCALDAAVVQAILTQRQADRSAAHGNPRWLELAIGEVLRLEALATGRRQLGRFGSASQRLTRLQQVIVNEMPTSIATFHACVIERAERLHGAAACRAFLTLLASARAGLRTTDLAVLLPEVAEQQASTPATAAAAALLLTFAGHIVQRGAIAQWVFVHDSLRAAVFERYLSSGDEKRRLHAYLTTHMARLPVDDPLRQSETMVHLIGADDRRGAAEYYGSELVEHETAAATTVLTSFVLGADPRAIEWVAGLTTQPIGDEALGRLSHRFCFLLAAELTPHAALVTRKRLIDAARAALERLSRLRPQHAIWQRDQAVTHYELAVIAAQTGRKQQQLAHLNRCADILHAMGSADVVLDQSSRQVLARLDTRIAAIAAAE